MDNFILVVLAAVVSGAVAFAAGYFVKQRAGAEASRLAQVDAGRIVEEARTNQKELILEAKEEAVKIKSAAEQDARERRAEVQRREQRLAQREETFERKSEGLEKRDRGLVAKESEIEAAHEEAERLRDQQHRELERVSGLTTEQAHLQLMATVEEQARDEASQLIREMESQTKEEAGRRARWIVSQAIQRCAADVVVESTQSMVNIPNDEMKGRIIGREGRNIRAFELATGVDVIIDDTPDTVVVSCFDPIRRETARLALEKLVADGRIHPGRIEEVVNKSRKEVEAQMQEVGEQAAYESGVHGLHPELIKLVGRMKWRTSYGQNILQHSKEVAWLAGIMAAELGLDVALARRGALLHDVGKVLTHEHEGTHVQLGVENATRYGENPMVVNCIAAHHDDVPHESEVSVLVQAADAISGSRPGARREAFETYVKRLEGLEKIAASYRGVEKVFAIQAGREVRVIVTAEEVDDARMQTLTGEIARRIESELQYPGQIKVVAIRETRAVEFAR